MKWIIQKDDTQIVDINRSVSIVKIRISRMENVKDPVRPEMKVRLGNLRAAFSLIRGVDIGKSIAIRWSPQTIDLIAFKPGFRCEVTCPLVATQDASPRHQWSLETDITLFDQILCNDKVWKTFPPSPDAIVSIRFRDLSTELRQEELPNRIAVDVRCLNWAAKRHFRTSEVDKSLTRSEGININPQAVGSTMSAALPFADKRADERYQLIEYVNGSAQAGSPRGLRVVQSARASSVTVRAGRSYAKALCSAFSKMDPQNTMTWSSENMQHIADDQMHCAILESHSDVPSAKLAAVPVLSASMPFLKLMNLVFKATGQMSKTEEMLSFVIEVGDLNYLKFIVRVRGGEANITCPIAVSEKSDLKHSRFEAKLPKSILSKIGEGISVANHMATLTFTEKFLRIDVEDSEITVRSLLAYDGILTSAGDTADAKLKLEEPTYHT